MPDSLITSSFDRALNLSPETRPYTPGQRCAANLLIASFLLLATALGIAETEFVSLQDKGAWRAWGAPLGMVQYWRIFAPDLRPINWHSTALIEFSDGSLKFYEFPWPDKMSLWEAFVRAPDRVFFFEHLANLPDRKMLPSVARFLARANYDPTNQPKTVSFLIYSAKIAVPGKDAWVYRDSPPLHTWRQTYFTYQVLPADLVDLSKH